MAEGGEIIIKRLGILALILGVICMTTGCDINEAKRPQDLEHNKIEIEEPDIKPAEKNYGNGTIYSANGDVSLTDEQQTIILDYVDNYYKSLSNLEVSDALTENFDTKDPIHKLANEKALATLIEIRKLQSIDLSLSDYEFELRVNAVDEKENGDIQVRITEDNELSFTAYPELISKNQNVWHYFMLTKSQDAWKIQRHVHADNIMRAMMDTYSEAVIESEATEALISQANSLADEIYEDAQNQMSLRSDTARYNIDEPESWDNTYDVKAALTYSRKWFASRNPDWLEYDMYGGNCNNFISQCLYEGGIPMDYTGENKWKWNGDSVNTGSSKFGRTPSWTGVDEFYDYAKYNTGKGLVALVDADFYTGREGDILQMGFMGEWKHSVIITAVVRDEEGNIVDYLINSNTADQYNYPASAYAYTMQRLIKIYGWND